MKNKMKYWLFMFFAAVFSLSLWGCGDISTGNEELDQAIVDMVVDGVNSYLEDAVGGENEEPPANSIADAEEVPAATETPTPVPTKKPTPTEAPTATPKPTATTKPTSTPKPTATPAPAIDEDGWYYSKDEVALYIYTYGKLPENFITKSEAQDLGWTGGTVENYKEGAAIGGDKFGNREGLLPKKSGRQYYECDIDTKGKGSRGAKRIVFSNDGLIYYTGNHYESFELLYGEE